MPSFDVSSLLPADTYLCQVQRITSISRDMWEVELHLPAHQSATFWPGQHLLLEVTLENSTPEAIPYSIAVAPASIMNSQPERLELHIAGNSPKAERVLQYLREHVQIKVTLPFGDCVLHPEFVAQHAQRPLIMLASGSGFAQIKCLTEAALQLNPNQEIHLYWSNKQADDFYKLELLDSWQQQFSNVRCHVLLDTPTAGWSGRSGWLYQAVKEDFSQLQHCQVFACGSPNMVYGTLDKLAPLGLSEANMHSDVFAYAPRPHS